MSLYPFACAKKNELDRAPFRTSVAMHKRAILSLAMLFASASCNEPLTPLQPDRGLTPPEVGLRRLTAAQYRRSVADLLIDEPTWATRFEGAMDYQARLPAERTVHGFENYGAVQRPSAALVEAHLRGSIFAALEGRALCGRDGESCERALLAMAELAFRGPLAPTERDQLLNLYNRFDDPATGTSIGAQWVLLHPRFMYLIERGVGAPDANGRVRLSGHEVAARLSFFIWGSVPDRALFNAADSGRLDTRSGVFQEASRMVRDPRARHGLLELSRQWLDFERVERLNPDFLSFELFRIVNNPNDAEIVQIRLRSLVAAMRQEMERFVEMEFFEGSGTLRGLLTSRRTYADDMLRYLYGLGSLPGPGGEVEPCEPGVDPGCAERCDPDIDPECEDTRECDPDLDPSCEDTRPCDPEVDPECEETEACDPDLDPACEEADCDPDEDPSCEEREEEEEGCDDEYCPRNQSVLELDPRRRAGFLTLASHLAAHSYPRHPAPIRRSLFVLERFLCAPPPPPPPGIDPSGVAGTGSSETPRTNRQRHAAHTTNETCSSCHARIDPIGFSFEHYDAIGAYRTSDNGLTVDASGDLSALEMSFRFNNAVELVEYLAENAQVYDCVARQWMRYALGRDLGPADMESFDEVRAAFRSADGAFQELVLAIVQSDSFLTREVNP